MKKLILVKVIRFLLLVILLYIFLYNYGLGIFLFYEWMPFIGFVKLNLLQLAIIVLLIGKPRKPEIALLIVAFCLTILMVIYSFIGRFENFLHYMVTGELWYDSYKFHKFVCIISDLLNNCVFIIFFAKLFISSIRYTMLGIKYYKSQKQDNV